jgi:hypothetical protein
MMKNTRRRALEDEEDAEKMKKILGLGFRHSPTPPEPSAGEEAREPASKQRTTRQAPLDRRRVAAEE